MKFQLSATFAAKQVNLSVVEFASLEEATKFCAAEANRFPEWFVWSTEADGSRVFKVCGYVFTLKEI